MNDPEPELLLLASRAAVILNLSVELLSQHLRWADRRSQLDSRVVSEVEGTLLVEKGTDGHVC